LKDNVIANIDTQDRIRYTECRE